MKKLLALLLVALMLLTAGCGGSNSAPNDEGADAPDKPQSTETEYPVIRLMQHRFSPDQCADELEIEEALNRIFREKCGCEVDIIFLNFGDVPDKLNLLLSGGKESLDIFSSLTFSSTADMAVAGQVLDLTPYLDDELKETYEMFSQYPGVLGCTTIEGKLYGIPSMTAWSSPNIYACKESYAAAVPLEDLYCHGGGTAVYPGVGWSGGTSD